MMNRLKYTLVLLCVFMFNLGFSQPPPPGGSGPSCWPPPCVPVDQGWYLLFAAGVILGVYSMLEKRSYQRKTIP